MEPVSILGCVITFGHNSSSNVLTFNLDVESRFAQCAHSFTEIWNCKVFDDYSDELIGLSGALESLKDLELNTSSAILAQRSSERIEINIPIMLRPGNSSERARYAIKGMTGDISNGGCLLLVSRPVLPGDIYSIEFDQTAIRIGPQLARCMRCKMIKDDAFEAGLRFFYDIELATSINNNSSELK